MVGQTVSHYRILEKLGEGGMGVVYKAEDTRLRRNVALKFLPGLTAENEQQRKRFENEARAAARLNHPNIATIFEFGEVRDPPAAAPESFMAMELVEGVTLRHLLRQGPLNSSHILSILSQIARGLQEAHRKGVVHRDLKPANVIVRPDGTAKILDFGVAHLRGETSSSQSGSVAGSIPYMSPEQIRGENVDSRADLWSFGVMAFELLTGKLPFRGDHAAALMYSITNEAPADSRQHRIDVPEVLHTIIGRCLEKEPRNRPRSVDEILSLLERETKKAPSREGFRRRGHVRALTALGVVMLACAAVWYLLLHSPPTEKNLMNRWAIGVLPYSVSAQKEETAGWPLLIQTMVANELTGVEQLAVYDPLSLNSRFPELLDGGRFSQRSQWSTALRQENLAFAVHGTVFTSSRGYTIQTNLVSTGSNELLFSHHADIRTEGDLPAAIHATAEKVLGYFETQALSAGQENDLRPWHASRVRDVEATKAFLQASQLVFKAMPGVEDYLNRAIALDSSFVGARVWLISRLGKQADLKKAQEHYRALLRLEPEASPFDQHMIRWAGAFLEGNLIEQERYLELALGYSPGNNILLANLAYYRYQRSDYRGAIEALENALASRWRYPPIYPLAARCYVKLKQFEKASSVAHEALSIQPAHPILFSVLASLSHFERDSTAAIRFEETLLTPARGDVAQLARTHQMLSEDLLDVGLTTKAIHHLELSLAFDSISAESKAVRLKLDTLLRK